jgi:uncharacterized heparinase superfamily protein
MDAARHVRPGQLAGRARRLVPPALLATGLAPRSAARFDGYAAGLGADPAPQSGPTPDPAESGTFVAFGRSREAEPERLWESGPEGLLFAFHVHGFAPLAAYAAGQRNREQDEFWAGIVESWLRAETRPALPAWHPYPTSLRLVAWCSALGALTGWSEALRARVAAEIARQAHYLARAVEYDIGGNHVLKNATALVFAGVTVPEAGVLQRGLRLLRRGLAKQILPDGAHEELSTSYHREVYEDLRSVQTLLGRAGMQVPGWLDRSALSAERWQAAVAGPEGDLPLLGDAWDGPLVARNQTPTEQIEVLSPSGHVVMRAGRDQAVFDCGPLCPDYLPPHAHADALGFVLWIDGEPVVVDRGAFAYTGPERDAFRATRAHSTVEVDGQDQCVFWGDFRAGLLPRVEPPRVRREDGLVIVESSHDGYRRLPDPVVHHRALIWVPGEGAVVVDRLECRGQHAIHSRLQLAPGLEPGRTSVVITPIPGATETERVWHAPYLGTRVEASALVVQLTIGTRTPFGWSILRPGTTARLSTDDAVEVIRGQDVVRVSLRKLN